MLGARDHGECSQWGLKVWGYERGNQGKNTDVGGVAGSCAAFVTVAPPFTDRSNRPNRLMRTMRGRGVKVFEECWD